MSETEGVKEIVRSIYDVQDLRIQMGGRIVAHHQQRLPEGTEAKEIYDRLKRENELLANRLIEEIPTDERLLQNRMEQHLAKSYLEILSTEKALFRELERFLMLECPIYSQWMKSIRGCGAATAGMILANIDIRKAKYVSSIWRYCGLDVAKDGRGRGRYKEHLVDQEYTDKDGNNKTKKSLGYNPQVRSMLLGVTADSMIKLRSPYRDHYDNYKHRISTDPKHKDKTKLHIHNMAKRYMIKMFLADLYAQWRKMEGLEVHPPYSEAKQGHVHNSPAA